MTVIDPKKLRIVCTKCVRHVRVHHAELEALRGSVFVATECCERVVGSVGGEVLRKIFHEDDPTRAVSLHEVTRITELDVRALEMEELAARATLHAGLARWALGGELPKDAQR